MTAAVQVKTRGFLHLRTSLLIPAYVAECTPSVFQGSAHTGNGSMFGARIIWSSARFDHYYGNMRASADELKDVPVYHQKEPASDDEILAQFGIRSGAQILIGQFLRALAICDSLDGCNFLPPPNKDNEVRLIGYAPTRQGIVQKIEATRYPKGFELDTFELNETHEVLGKKDWTDHTFVLSSSAALYTC